jgi:hypothetical protein
VVFQDCFCKNCDEKLYMNQSDFGAKFKWCKLCQVNNLKENFANWTSGNKKIDNFIQEMQLKISKYDNIIVEWIPYNQFDCVRKIGKGGLL